jgi:hypothetical protein
VSFTAASPDFVARFAGYLLSEVDAELADRLDETDLRSALAIMASATRSRLSSRGK